MEKAKAGYLLDAPYPYRLWLGLRFHGLMMRLDQMFRFQRLHAADCWGKHLGGSPLGRKYKRTLRNVISSLAFQISQRDKAFSFASFTCICCVSVVRYFYEVPYVSDCPFNP